MKNQYRNLFLLLFTLFFLNTLTAQTFVKQDATGTNDGTSWDNAFTSFSDALTNTTSGEIWVASGTYKPGGMAPDSSSTFRISNAISVFGGFAGTETNISERDLAANVTILSGDINGDDDENDLFANRSDNIQHIMVVDSLIASTVTIDGFNYIGGNTSDFPDQSDFFWRGGGIITYTTVNITNCNFSENFGRGGASVFISSSAGGGDGSIFENCVFSNNTTTQQSSGIYLEFLDDITINNCTFSNNQSNRGVLYPNTCTNVNVSDCMFNDNSHIFTDGFGGVLFNWQSTGYTFTDCTFMNNTGGNGGVMYHDGRLVPMDADNLVFQGCHFEGNNATDFGGGVMYTWMSSYTFDDCTFLNNSGSNGGCIFNTASDNKEVVINSCSFEGNSAAFGAAMTCYGDTSNYTITNNTFTNGAAVTSAGALIIGFEATATIDSCEFISNAASFGGAIYGQNEGTIIELTNSIFTSNEVSNSGGAISFNDGGTYTVDNNEFIGGTAGFGGGMACYGSNTVYNLTNNTFRSGEALTSGGALIIGFSANVNIDSCDFSLNEALFGGAIYVQNDTTTVNMTNSFLEQNASSNTGGAILFGGAGTHTVDKCEFSSNVSNFGGAVAVSEFVDSNLIEMSFMLTNSIFDSNVAETQAAGLNIFNGASTIYNNIFSNNFNSNTDSGSGGALSINVGDSTTRTITLINNTIVNNIAPVGAGIATFTSDAGMESFLNLNLQNNLIFNPDGNDYQVEGGIPDVVSQGGNINGDASTLLIFTDATDQVEVADGGFVDPNSDDYRLLPTSVAVNAGVATGAPSTDIIGVPRDDMPDVGAYEYDFVNSVKETIIENTGALKILPNPVNELLTFELINEWQGDLVVRIFNISGKEVKNFEINKFEKVLLKSTSVAHLTTGIYHIVISNGEEAVVEKLLKR